MTTPLLLRPYRALLIVLSLALGLSAAARAFDGIVEKKTFHMDQLTTVGGKTIKDVRIGYETYGTRNADGSNAIFIAHFFSGTSHAAGKYAATDAAPGYWDSIIGAGKPIDTDKYFVIAADSLVNLSPGNPKVVTTGPASINPDTGKPYGMTFPIVTIRDFVNTQKALVDALGVTRLQAVIGASMGSMQAMEWASAYPALVARTIAVIPMGLQADAYQIATFNAWAAPILNDPLWNGGDYYGKPAPVRGLAHALELVTLASRHYGWAAREFDHRWSSADGNPLDSWDNHFAIEDAMTQGSAARASGADANSFLYLVRANQLFRVGQGATLAQGLQSIRANVLFVPAASDLLMYRPDVEQAAALLNAQGSHAEIVELKGDGGHLDGVFLINQAGPAIRSFLSR